MLYSPRIDQHTRQLYRLGQLLGKPMTRVADDLLKHGLANIEDVYGQELATRWQEVKTVAVDPPPRSRKQTTRPSALPPPCPFIRAGGGGVCGDLLNYEIKKIIPTTEAGICHAR